MSLFVVDVEADGPIPGDYSMLSFAAVKVEEGFKETFESGPLKVLEDSNYQQDAITSIGLSYDAYVKIHVNDGANPVKAMEAFDEWIRLTSRGRPIFMSDNNGFDWMFICWYFHHFLKRNPFGFSSRRIGDLYCGLVKDTRAQWKHLRKTVHDHNPVNDAKGNAEAILYMVNNMGLK